jgi:hypothetical protein
MAEGLQLRGEDVMRLLMQDFRSIGIDGCGDPDVAACERHVLAVGHSAQTDGVVFVMQKGKEFFAGLKSDSAATAAAAAARTAAAAIVFEGSWSDVFDAVVSCINLQP